MYRFLEGLNPGDLAKFGGQDYEKDVLGGLLGVISMSHYEIHKGKHFTAHTDVIQIPGGGTMNMVLTVPAGTLGHLVFEMSAFEPWYGGLYEGPTINAPGAALVEFNNNRDSTETAGIEATINATLGAPGDLLRPVLGGGTGIGGSSSSSVGGSRAEFILTTGEYALVLNGTAAELAYIVAEWYE